MSATKVVRVAIDFDDGERRELDGEAAKEWQDRVAGMEGLWASRGWTHGAPLPWKITHVDDGDSLAFAGIAPPFDPEAPYRETTSTLRAAFDSVVRELLELGYKPDDVARSAAGAGERVARDLAVANREAREKARPREDATPVPVAASEPEETTFRMAMNVGGVQFAPRESVRRDPPFVSWNVPAPVAPAPASAIAAARAEYERLCGRLYILRLTPPDQRPPGEPEETQARLAAWEREHGGSDEGNG